MAEMSPQLPEGQEDRIPFWRDGRIIGVMLQIGFVIIVVSIASWLINNVTENIGALGAFRCPDGTSSVRCGFSFLGLDAQFDISETMIEYEPSDAYSRALLVGALNTVKVGFFGIIFATILGTLAGIARLSNNWLISNVAKWYVDLIRNTPLLLQLFFLFFGVILLLPPIQQAIQPLGLPIFLSQRGINIPGPAFMPSFAIWLAFVVLGLLQAQALWVMLGRREERTGRSSNRTTWVIVSFLLVIVVGWFVTTASANGNQGFMAGQALRIREYGDLATQMEARLGIENLATVELALEDGDLTTEQIQEAAYTLCAVEGDPSEVNFTAQLRRDNIPYDIDRSDTFDQARESYGSGECEMMVAATSILGSERNLLEDPNNNRIVAVTETPLRIDVPQVEGLNFVGGIKLSPNFAAILIGLVVYTGAFIAEIVRAGIQSVSKGQSEAASALGLTESQRLRLVVLPQALRVIIPPLTSQYLNLVKNSSLAIAVGYPDMWSVSFTTLNQSGQAVQVFLIVMAGYLTFSLIISFFLNWYNRRIALVER